MSDENERLQRDLDYWVAQALRVDTERRKLETALREILKLRHDMEVAHEIAKEALGDD